MIYAVSLYKFLIFESFNACLSTSKFSSAPKYSLTRDLRDENDNETKNEIKVLLTECIQLTEKINLLKEVKDYE